VKTSIYPIRRSVKVCALLLALVALLAVSAASDSPAHFHDKQQPSNCDLCYVAHFAACGTPVVQPLHAPSLEGRAAPVAAFFSYEQVLGNPACSRGPPSITPVVA
jgi:hypothetical protein